MELWLRSGMPCRREQKHSQWEFPDWIPVAHRWTCLSDRYRGSRAKGKVGQVSAGSGVSEGMGATCAFTPLSLSVVGFGGLVDLAVEQHGQEQAVWRLGWCRGTGQCWGALGEGWGGLSLVPTQRGCPVPASRGAVSPLLHPA